MFCQSGVFGEKRYECFSLWLRRSILQQRNKNTLNIAIILLLHLSAAGHCLASMPVPLSTVPVWTVSTEVRRSGDGAVKQWRLHHWSIMADSLSVNHSPQTNNCSAVRKYLLTVACSLDCRLSARSEFEMSVKIGIIHWNKHRNRLGIVWEQPRALSQPMLLLTL